MWSVSVKMDMQVIFYYNIGKIKHPQNIVLKNKFINNEQYLFDCVKIIIIIVRNSKMQIFFRNLNLLSRLLLSYLLTNILFDFILLQWKKFLIYVGLK